MTSKLNNLYIQQNSGWQADSLTIHGADSTTMVPFMVGASLRKPSWIDSCPDYHYPSNSLSAIDSLRNEFDGNESNDIEYGQDQLGVRGGMRHELPTNQVPAFALQWVQKWSFGERCPLLRF